MKLPPVTELSPSQALAAAVQASTALQKKLHQLDTLAEDAEDTQLLESIEELTAIRDQLIRQTFAHPWQEDQVEQHLAQLNQLESLNAALIKQQEEVRNNLFQQRVSNQQGRKAVSAYGKAKSQWQV